MTEKKYTLEEVSDLHKAIGSPVQDRNSNPADNTWFALKDNWIFILFILGGAGWIINNMFSLQTAAMTNSNRIESSLEAIKRNQDSISDITKDQELNKDTINSIFSAVQLTQRDVADLKANQK